jgi:hypothetical protein
VGVGAEEERRTYLARAAFVAAAVAKTLMVGNRAGTGTRRRSLRRERAKEVLAGRRREREVQACGAFIACTPVLKSLTSIYVSK